MKTISHVGQEKTAATDNGRHSISRRRFVTFVLIGHAIVMRWNIPSVGFNAGTVPSDLFAYYFTYSSMPFVLVAPFVSDSAREGIVLFIPMLVNGVLVAWLKAIGLHLALCGAPEGSRSYTK